MSTQVCSNCGSELRTPQSVCPRCGASLSSTALVPYAPQGLARTSPSLPGLVRRTVAPVVVFSLMRLGLGLLRTWLERSQQPVWRLPVESIRSLIPFRRPIKAQPEESKTPDGRATGHFIFVQHTVWKSVITRRQIKSGEPDA